MLATRLYTLAIMGLNCLVVTVYESAKAMGSGRVVPQAVSVSFFLFRSSNAYLSAVETMILKMKLLLYLL